MTKDELYGSMISLLASDPKLQSEFVVFFNANKDKDSFLELFSQKYGDCLQVEDIQSKETVPNNEPKAQEIPKFALPDKYPIVSEELLSMGKDIAKIAFWVRFWSILSIIGAVIWIIVSILR